MSHAMRPCDNPFNAQRIDALPYLPLAVRIDEVMSRLQTHGYRGALVGPHGCGKSALLDALGDELEADGLTARRLFINRDRPEALPGDWRDAVWLAGPTDALLLDGYDLLPRWARAWVLLRSRGAGAVIATTHQKARLPTVAEPKPTVAVFSALLEQLAPQVVRHDMSQRLFQQAQGNLRDALRLAYDWYAEHGGVAEQQAAPGRQSPKRARQAVRRESQRIAV